MDPNKLEVLQKNRYKIQRCCGRCTHGSFTASDNWGFCMVKTYRHKKHNRVAHLSIHKFGICADSFEPKGFPARGWEGLLE